uniref:NADH dehydrogenase subunit 4L n=1 Tax=Taenia laticollis TaxID=1035110 RepID=N0DQT1_9CEST|nr:NADH dehydrogenase subunit 4L [Taenia laticollis]BAN15632.1 NADH dehydrogenase subunit 4L [Taenia laticollis]
MVTLYLLYSSVILVSFLLSISRFLNSLILLENFNVLVLLFCLLLSENDSHMLFMSLMIISTVEVIIGLVMLTCVWECSYSIELVDF